MGILDILRLSLRNLREAKLRTALTMLGVVVGVAVIVTFVSLGLGLQRNTVERLKEVDLLNEITVFGRDLSELATSVPTPGDRRNGRSNRRKPSDRILNDATIGEIRKLPLVTSVSPDIDFMTYVRFNNISRSERVEGTISPNPSSRFKEFVAGSMINPSETDAAIVSESFAHDYGFKEPAEIIGKQIELLAPSMSAQENERRSTGFFGLPLVGSVEETNESPAKHSFRIVGVVKNSESGSFGNFGRGGSIFIPIKEALAWTRENRSPFSQLSLQLARQKGALAADEDEGYNSAVVRVSDPPAVTEVRERLSELGFSSFSLSDQLNQIRTFFLVVNSVLGLLGGISLLVAAFGIANTMIMSIFERTREIGIMKAIGGEDREIKLIFFIEAGVMGLIGGLIGSGAAWGIDKIANRLAYYFLLRPRGSPFIDFFSIPLYLSLGAVLFAVLVSIIAALYPASRAARIDPVKALRHD